MFGKVDTEAQPALAAAFGISSIPTLMVIRNGVILYARPGALPEPALEQLIARARALDVDEVRASIAEGTEAAGSPAGVGLRAAGAQEGKEVPMDQTAESLPPAGCRRRRCLTGSGGGSSATAS